MALSFLILSTSCCGWSALDGATAPAEIERRAVGGCLAGRWRQVVRLGRYLNVALGLIIAFLPWWIEGATLASRLNTSAAGLLILAFSLPLGPKTERYGMWEKWVR